MKNRINFKILILTVVVCLLPMLAGVYFYNDLPDKLPGHFNFKNEVDRYDPKPVVLFVYPSVVAVIHIVMCLFIDLSKKDDRKEIKLVYVLKWFMPLLSCCLVAISISSGFNIDVNVGKIVLVVLSILFILVGNYTPKMTYEDGKRTINIMPKNEEDFKKLVRIMGFAFVIGGIMTLIASFFDPIIALGILFGDCLVIAVYSCYYTFK